MRHGFLEGKYDDYSKLNFYEFKNLLTKKVTPEVNKERTKAILLKKRFLREIDFIICSTESRGIETAQIVNEITKVDYKKSPFLNEISFMPGIISRNDVADFDYLRKKILTSFYNSKYSERFEDVKKRFVRFIEYVKEFDYDTILCITHGWFMRLIYIYSVKNSLDEVSLQELLEARVPNFLDTIEINL